MYSLVVGDDHRLSLTEPDGSPPVRFTSWGGLRSLVTTSPPVLSLEYARPVRV